MTAQAFAPALGPAACAVALACMAAVAVRDMRSFEIDPVPLLGAALASLAAACAVEGPSGAAGSLAAAGLAWAVARAVARLLPGRIGGGDVWLFAAMAAAAGIDLMAPMLALFAAFAAAAGAAYSLARGKRLFRSMVPAALPGMAAAGLALVWRAAVPQASGNPAAGTEAAALLLLAAAAVMAGGAVLRGKGTAR